MLEATERARPILQYVRELENKVRAYQAQDRDVSLRAFFTGFLIGAACMGIVSFLRWLHG